MKHACFCILFLAALFFLVYDFESDTKKTSIEDEVPEYFIKDFTQDPQIPNLSASKGKALNENLSIHAQSMSLESGQILHFGSDARMESESSTFTHYAWAKLTDSHHEAIWEETFSHTENNLTRFISSAVQTSDNGFIFTIWHKRKASEESPTSRAHLLKVSSDGKEEWSKEISNQGSPYPTKIISTNDGDYLLVGFTIALGQSRDSKSDIFAVKINEDGEELWSKIYPTSFDEHCSDIILLEDGSIAILGSVFLPIENYIKTQSEIFLMKINSSGKFLWEKTYGNSDLKDEGVNIFKKDGLLYLFCRANIYRQIGPTPKLQGIMELLAVDYDGNKHWIALYGDDSYHILPSAAHQTSDGFVLAGEIAREWEPETALIMKVSYDGTPIWRSFFENDLSGISTTSIIESSPLMYDVSIYTGMIVGKPNTLVFSLSQ